MVIVIAIAKKKMITMLAGIFTTAATVVVSCKDLRGRYQARRGGGSAGFLCPWGNDFFQAAALAAGTNNRPQLSPGGSGSSNVAGRQRWLGLGLPYRMAGGRHLLPTSTSSLSNKKDGHRKVRAISHGSHCCCWRHPRPSPLVTTTMSAMMIGIYTGVRCPPHRALVLRLNAWLYLMESLTACATLLGHAIVVPGTQSTPMANYVDNGRWQERAADDACHILMRECTSQRC